MSVRPSAIRPRRAFSWLGLFALVGGGLLIYLHFERPPVERGSSPMTTAVYLGTGLILILWGLKAVLGDLFAAVSRYRNRHTRRYRVTMPRAAQVYVLILVVLLLGALLGRSNILLLVFSLMAGPYVLNGQVTLAILNRILVSRTLPQQAVVGQPFTVRIKLANRKRILSSWVIVVEDTVQHARELLEPAVLFTQVPPRSEREAAYEIQPAQRGVYTFGPMKVTSRFPLGLMERSLELGPAAELLVFPRIGRLTPKWRQQGQDAGSADQALVLVGGHDDEFHRLREYRPGDNPRAIHWRTTARRNELFVREYQQHRAQDLMVLLDLWQPQRPTDADRERIELAISFAATLCVDQSRSGGDANIRLFVCGDQVTRAAGSGNAFSVAGLLEHLAVVSGGQARELPSVIREALEVPGEHFRRVLVSTRPKDQPPMAPTGGSESGGGAAFEVVRSDPAELSEYVEFDN